MAVSEGDAAAREIRDRLARNLAGMLARHKKRRAGMSGG